MSGFLRLSRHNCILVALLFPREEGGDFSRTFKPSTRISLFLNTYTGAAKKERKKERKEIYHFTNKKPNWRLFGTPSLYIFIWFTVSWFNGDTHFGLCSIKNAPPLLFRSRLQHHSGKFL